MPTSCQVVRVLLEAERDREVRGAVNAEALMYRFKDTIISTPTCSGFGQSTMVPRMSIKPQSMS
jgi:hypothetical protein